MDARCRRPASRPGPAPAEPTAPPAPDPAAETRYVPIYKGEVLMDDAGAKLLEESAAAPYAAQDGCVVAWLGTWLGAPASSWLGPPASWLGPPAS